MYGNFSQEAVLEAQNLWDFTRCQRSDGTYYGTSGKCRKGKSTGKKARPESSAKQKPPVARRAGGQSLDGDKLDYGKLKKRVSEWVKKNGLGDSDDQVPGHDQTHILVQDYLGKTSKTLGALLGERTKGGPTVFEEAVVEALQTLSAQPNIDKTRFFPQAARESFALSESMDVLPKDHLFRRNPQRAIALTSRYLEAIARRPDFDRFLSTVRTANDRAMEEA